MSVEQWEQRRRKGVLHSYYKELRKTPGYSRPERNSTEEAAVSYSKRPPKLTAYQAAQLEYERKQAEKAAKLEELTRKREEKSAAIAKYKARKTEIYKKLSKKTKKGQPVMKGRLELLLEKLEKSIQS
ncbi:hypothetical protein C0J52_11162 [Blattella germanica]|nr:hypothetical protein C0J52_11162 [Blattella germanica]